MKKREGLALPFLMRTHALIACVLVIKWEGEGHSTLLSLSVYTDLVEGTGRQITIVREQSLLSVRPTHSSDVPPMPKDALRR